MKKPNRKPNKARVIKDLAQAFDSDMSKTMPVTVLPNGDVSYKDFIIKPTGHQTWGIYQHKGQELLNEYYLKTCALMAAKYYSACQLERYSEVKRLDTRYWACHSDSVIFKNNMKLAKELDRYIVLLNKLEDAESKAAFYKDAITRMFKWAFV